jgi:hypothetical protein
MEVDLLTMTTPPTHRRPKSSVTKSGQWCPTPGIIFLSHLCVEDGSALSP